METYEQPPGGVVPSARGGTGRLPSGSAELSATVALSPESLIFDRKFGHSRERKPSRRRDFLETIANLSHDIFRCSPMKEGVGHLLEKLSCCLHLDHFHYYRFDPQSNSMRMVSEFCPQKRPGFRAPDSLPMSSLHGWCLQKRYEHHCSEELHSNPRWLTESAFRESDLTSGVFLTVPGKNAPQGILAAFTFANRPFGDEEIQFLKAGAGILAAYGERIRLSETIQELEREILSTGEEERKRISHELHDGLCHGLMALKFRAAYLDGLAKKTSGDARKTGGLESEINQLLTSTQTFAREMHPEFSAARDLVTVLRDLAESVENQFRIHCTFRGDGSYGDLPENVVGNLFRITQEAISNGIRHGQAQRIEIHLRQVDNATELTVKNDGLSFDPRKSAGRGMGLRIMNYRARSIGATISIGQIRPQGTRLTCSLPR